MSIHTSLGIDPTGDTWRNDLAPRIRKVRAAIRDLQGVLLELEREEESSNPLIHSSNALLLSCKVMLVKHATADLYWLTDKLYQSASRRSEEYVNRP